MNTQKILELRKKALLLPAEPGVYLMKNNSGEIIYVGKAKRLKNRVVSYFRSVENHHPKVLAMVMQLNDFETIVTTNEFEALVLECSLIKLHNPKYNILLKDDKGYSYLRIDSSEYPKITEVKKTEDDGARYIGPYMSAWVVKNISEETNKIFSLPTCSKQFPRDFRKSRPCLNYYLKQCMGLCTGKISSNEYNDAVNQAVDYIKGGSEEAVKSLVKQMEVAAENLEFEKAARCRDRLKSIEKFAQRQRVVYAKAKDQDVLSFVKSGDSVMLCILRFREKRLVDKLDFIFPETKNIEDMRGEFIAQYYSGASNELPSQLTVDGNVTDCSLIEQLLSEKLGKKVSIVTPQRGEGVKLVEMARVNAAQQLAQLSNKRLGRELAELDELASLLGLHKPPEWIEAYDISNIGQSIVVGAMTVFENGVPQKAAYKRFAIRDIYKNDDYASMAQMLRRRFEHYLEQSPKGGFFNRMPDLLLIDGGQGHVSTVKNVLDDMNLTVPVFGMVKDDKHKTRAISSQGGEIVIKSNRNVFTLISKIQEETHRFAVEYARTKHKKSALERSLTKIDGIGAKRASILFEHFRTKKAIMNASIEELSAVKGMTNTAANALRKAIDEGEIS